MKQLGPEPPLERIRQETASNHEVFLRLRANFTRHEGEYALMRSGMVIDFFPDARSAMFAGGEQFPDRVYSVHRVRTHGANRGGLSRQPKRRGLLGLLGAR